jgi:exodeoxyribonuclease VII small subunit
MSADQLPYEILLQELNEVLSRIERDETGIDELSTAVEQAYSRVKQLRARLHETEARLKEVISMRDLELGQPLDQNSEAPDPKL